MTLQKLGGDFTVCKLENIDHVDFTRGYIFLSKTDDEISLVCETAHTPPHTIHSEPNWKGLKVAGILDFGMIGVIARISGILAEAGISIFVVSTFNTDYVFVKAENYDRCVEVLVCGGFVVGTP